MLKKPKINPNDQDQADLIIERLSRPRRTTEEEIAAILAEEIAKEIDTEIIKQLATSKNNNNNTTFTLKDLNTRIIDILYYRNIK